jgi:hypothetical protein
LETWQKCEGTITAELKKTGFEGGLELIDTQLKPAEEICEDDNGPSKNIFPAKTITVFKIFSSM